MTKDFTEKYRADFLRSPVIAILRGVTPNTVLEAACVLINAGIKFLEVTMNSPEAIKSIGMLTEKYGKDPDVYIGAGTVLNPNEVSNVISTGAQFIVSPNICMEVIKKTKVLGAISIPGFYTPSEAFTAIDAGADYLKLFPARSLGVRYIKDIKAVIPKPVIAVGGVDKDNMKEFLTVCTGVGIGSNLYSYGKDPGQLFKDALDLMGQITKK
ncbi:MAG: 2-dehydro-3-deoxy-6-phosphogalactonate aldolase [Candidatus Omnitrophica bacterium]|nr:2-dehydro-3-deoxy-6-phosphogalactonate aldolase [Candidatus Omnitrophota bacterium]